MATEEESPRSLAWIGTHCRVACGLPHMERSKREEIGRTLVKLFARWGYRFVKDTDGSSFPDLTTAREEGARQERERIVAMARKSAAGEVADGLADADGRVALRYFADDLEAGR